MNKAFILAAGLGTRLKPWTLTRPKALVPVGGIPMLQRVILSLKKQGFTEIVINVHHFANHILDFLATNDFDVNISISDETESLLDTGGAILNAEKLLTTDSTPFLVHNVDILSNANLSQLIKLHQKQNNDVTLLVSDRNSSRKLLFDKNNMLCGWHNLNTDEYRPAIDNSNSLKDCNEYAFSGIYAVSPSVITKMKEDGWHDKFPIMDFLLDNVTITQHNDSNKGLKIGAYISHDLKIIDIGKPETLKEANNMF